MVRRAERNGAWTRVTAGANNTFTFPVGSAGGFAMVRPDGPGFSTSVFYGSQAGHHGARARQSVSWSQSLRRNEAAHGIHRRQRRPRTHSSASAAPSIQHPAIQGAGFTLDGVPAGQRDLIAANFLNDANDVNSITRIILRRDVNYASAIPALSLTATEALVRSTSALQRTTPGRIRRRCRCRWLRPTGRPRHTRPPLATRQAGFHSPDCPMRFYDERDVHAIEFTARPASMEDRPGPQGILLRHSAAFDVDTVTFGPNAQPTDRHEPWYESIPPGCRGAARVAEPATTWPPLARVCAGVFGLPLSVWRRPPELRQRYADELGPRRYRI